MILVLYFNNIIKFSIVCEFIFENIRKLIFK